MSDFERIAVAGTCFRLFSACFCEPEKDLLEEQEVCSNLSRLSHSISSESALYAERMAEHLSGLEQQQLTLDYAALFVGPFELQAPPYGSVYLEKKRTVMGETTMDVLKFYQDAGLQVEHSEPADHVAIELEFMSFLLDSEVVALRQGDQDKAERCRDLRSRFFSSCFAPWIPEFCRQVRKGTDNLFYQALADCLNAYITAYRQNIDSGIFR